MSAQLAQFLASLAAILALAGLAWWLKLGPERRLNSKADAQLAAAEAIDGFEAELIAIDNKGNGALLSDSAGRILLLRPHGAHFVGRILTVRCRADLKQGVLHLQTSEKRFGSVRIEIEDAAAWVQRIEAIE